MSVEIDRPTLPCGACGARVIELRRGRCWGCYSRWEEARPVGKGAACEVCGERRRGELRLVELHGRSHPLCHSCNGKVARLDSIPRSLLGLRALLDRERRQGDRRDDGLDRRIFPRERRVGERRSPPRNPGDHDTDPRMQLPDFEDIIIELCEADVEVLEQTSVRIAARPDR